LLDNPKHFDRSARPALALVQENEPDLPARPRVRLRRLLPRLVIAVLLFQLLVFSLLTLTGWGALSGGDVNPPRMERIGPPPGLIGTYASLSHITYPLEYGPQGQLATAVFVGTPANWGGPEPAPPSLDVFGQSLGTTIHQFSSGSHNTILFVVPSATLQNGPLYVVIKGDRYRLTVVRDESSMGFAVAWAAVDNHLLSIFDSSLLWLTLPVPDSIRVPLMLIRRDPGSQTYLLTHGTLDVGSRGGAVASPVDGVTLGTPVVAITPTSNALAGFLERPGLGPSRFVATSVVSNVLNEVGPSVSGGS
jgi:hypothetical protein